MLVLVFLAAFSVSGFRGEWRSFFWFLLLAFGTELHYSLQIHTSFMKWEATVIFALLGERESRRGRRGYIRFVNQHLLAPSLYNKWGISKWTDRHMSERMTLFLNRMY